MEAQQLLGPGAESEELGLPVAEAAGRRRGLRARWAPALAGGLMLFALWAWQRRSGILLFQQEGMQVKADAASTGILPLTVQSCTEAEGCRDVEASVTLDQNWRWYYDPDTYKTCADCESTDCTDCVLQADIKYDSLGIATKGRELKLSKGSRIYLLDAKGDGYYPFLMVGKEFTVDVDVSKLPCGTNSALYFVEMETDGGYHGGAKLGTGYCDAQCPSDFHTLSGTPAASGRAQCCHEFDVWEGNREAAAMTQHACLLRSGSDLVGPYACSGKECNGKAVGGVCDSFGCDINPYKNGATDFYGKSGSTVDTNKPFTLTTQFVADDNGTLVEVRRFYKQDGKRIALPAVELNGKSFTSLTDEYCEQQLNLSTPSDDGLEQQDASTDEKCAANTKGAEIWREKGGLATSGRSFDRSNVLVLSLWNDPVCHMLWLDGGNTSLAGAAGPCGVVDDSGGDSQEVSFSNIKFGDIGSTA